MRLTLRDGLRTAQGGAELHDAVEQKTQIPSKATAFQIRIIDSSIVRNKEGEPDQILNIETSSDISTPELAKALHVYLLPKREPPKSETSEEEESTADESTKNPVRRARAKRTDGEESGSDEESETADKKPETKWANADEITDEILEQATVVKVTPIPTEKEFARDHHFKFRLEGEGQLYVRIDKGLKARSGYELAENHANIVVPAELPQEVEIQGDGGLLALGGERKLSIRSRGVAVIKFEIDRVLSTQINHLVSQTEGEFQAPEFKNASFDQDNISRIAREDQSIALQNKWKSNYSAFDFAQYLQKPADGGSERGLFFLTARAWDPVAKKFIKNASATRFILVSDLGLLVKKNADQTSDVFVVSIKTGLPLGGVTVEILGRNGIPVQSAKTSPDGRATFASVDKKRAREESGRLCGAARRGHQLHSLRARRSHAEFLALRHRRRGESPRGRSGRFRFHRSRRLPPGRRNAHRARHQAAQLVGTPRRFADRDRGGRRARSESADEEAGAAGQSVSPRSTTRPPTNRRPANTRSTSTS